jgi:hypothetical protein
MRCPKCNTQSGDGWTQCNGACPIPSSPHFNQQAANAFRPFITSAAILHPSGRIFRGWRHNQIISNMATELGERPVKGKQGFVTNRGDFVDRVEALAIAKDREQLKGEKIGNQRLLFSEDLW